MLCSISIGYSYDNWVIGQSSWSYKVNRCNYGKTRCNFILHFSDWGFFGRQLSWLTYRSIRMSRLKVPFLSWRLWNKWPYIFCLITWQIGQVPYRCIQLQALEMISYKNGIICNPFLVVVGGHVWKAYHVSLSGIFCIYRASVHASHCLHLY